MNETSDKVDFLQSKVLTIEKHLPIMIQEILEYYYDKKMSNFLSSLVTKSEFKEKLSVKLDYSVFRDYARGLESDRTQEVKNFHYDEKIYNLEKALKLYVTKEELNIDTRDMVRTAKIDEVEDNIKNL